MLRSVRIRLVRNTWERLARLDPYWAIVNRPDWRRNRTELGEFFANGRALIERQFTQVRAVFPEFPRGRALDFGCGVGRLSAALAAQFREVVGVDISARMIALARRHHAGVGNLTFVRNTRSDLQAFAAGEFDLVYSLIALQHVPAPFIRSYLGEFARICRPGGILLFQLPAREVAAARRNLWSVWPPTVAMRLRRVFNRIIPISPIIDVHCLAPESVRAALASAGAEVLAQWPDDSTGPAYESFLYLARRR
jgi:2-polyprenyl-3-methyl-5-hydroxy-6-metoxy-1,4-benzoquinol methylase